MSDYEQIKGALEENILTSLVWNEELASEIVMHLESGVFSTRIYRKIAEYAIAHVHAYSKPIGAHLSDQLERELERGADAELYRQTLDSMAELATHIQPEFIRDQLDKFVEARQLDQALEEASAALRQGRLTEAKERLTKLSPAKTQQEPIWFTNPKQSLAFLDKEESDFFSTGIEALDNMGVVPERKTMMLFIAPAKAGKSWFLVQCGKYGMMHRHSVLHISLENSAALTSRRYVQCFFSMTKKEAQTVRFPVFKRDKLGRFVATEIESFDARPINQDTREEVSKKLKKLSKRAPLVIQEFPTSTLTIAQLRAYLDMLKRSHNFEPDLLLLDYPDLMAVPGDSNQFRLGLSRIFKEVRGIAVERNLAAVVVTQGNRSSASAKLVNSTMVSEDWSKIGTADTVLVYSQTSKERQRGIARILVDAARDAEQKFIVMLSQAYGAGQFSLDSIYMNKVVEDDVKQMVGDGDSDDDGNDD